VVVGLSAPQGSGKTTMVEFLRRLAGMDSLRAAVLSIDDFYLTNAEQRVGRGNEGLAVLGFTPSSASMTSTSPTRSSGCVY
jgi:D-glycerate 3-kinase